MPAFSFALGKKISPFGGAFTKSAVSFGTEIFNEKPSSKRSAAFLINAKYNTAYSSAYPLLLCYSLFVPCLFFLFKLKHLVPVLRLQSEPGQI